MMTGFWRKIRYARPAARRELLDRLVDEVTRGTMDAPTALERYEKETRIVPWRPFFAPLAATHRLFRAAAARNGRKPKKVYAPPRATPFVETTEIPDDFPGARYLRRAGYTTYGEVFRMSDAELEAAAPHIGADAVLRIRALRPSP